MAMAPTVDPFAVEDPSELEDWHVPVSFMKSRHSERIRAEPPPEEAWRMKDRVSGLTPRSLAPPLYSFCTVKAWGWSLGMRLPSVGGEYSAGDIVNRKIFTLKNICLKFSHCYIFGISADRKYSVIGRRSMLKKFAF